MTAFKYRWAQWGDLNAFFGLMLDNVTILVLLTTILSGAFGYPAELVYKLMIPGTALGVLFGDAVFTWLAFRLAKRTGRQDVTAMPLGLDTPSSIGITLSVLGPVYLETHDPILTWQVGTATLMLIGILKLVMAFFGDKVRRSISNTGMLGSLAGIGIALLTFFPAMKIFSAPAAGLMSLGIILYTLVARRRLPGGLPGAFTAVAAGCAVYYLCKAFGIGGGHEQLVAASIQPAIPSPTLGFIHGMPKALAYFPVAFPYALLTIVGGINNTESARVAGDEYSTRSILLTEAVSTMVAALFGGVAQTTPYIGHPAYKAMGGRAAYTLGTGLFVGVGAVCGIMSYVVAVIPEPVITPILLFVGIEIVAEAFRATPRNHAPAVAFAMVPLMGYLVLIYSEGLIGRLGPGIKIPDVVASEQTILRAVGNGFIVTALLWGGMLAAMIDGKNRTAGLYALSCAVMALFGIIHSVAPSGSIYLPWTAGSPLVWQISLGYSLIGLGLLVSSALGKKQNA
ncbi:MAG: MFS transporter [Myxococcota bacterium]|jgi:AGZA family xanthine/uracil permease-like MFS transporter